MTQTIDLAGTWYIALDPADVGESGAWYARHLATPVLLPGSLQEQGLGDDVTANTAWIGSVFDDDYFVQERYAPYREAGNVKAPFWLTPAKRYIGVAWYQRTITIAPEQLQGRTHKHARLHLERTHWATRVWLDGREAGACDSLSTPHVYDLGALSAGTYTLTVRVDNRMVHNVGPNAHSVTDHTQTAWNGMIGDMHLALHDGLEIACVRVHPNVAHRLLRVACTLRDLALEDGAQTKVGLTVSATPQRDEANGVNTQAQDAQAQTTLLLGREEVTVELLLDLGEDAQEWDEFSPALYTLRVHATTASHADRRATEVILTTGLRQIGVDGRHIVLNGKRIYLRGTLECCVFPHTGYPAMDVEAWRRILRICKAHGLNHLRFHSWCPPEAAFQAADELGVYYQVECAAWANIGAELGVGASVDAWLYAEAARIVRTYGHHPSFVMLAHGNEPGGNDKEYLAQWVAYWKEHDRDHIHTSGAGWPALAENDYHDLMGARIQIWGDQLHSRINALPPETCTNYASLVEEVDKPLVSHEVGQWCVYPNFDEIPKYDGYLRAGNFEIFRDFLAQNHMGDQARDFLLASGKLQVLCYKEEIEALLRTPDMGGFQLLDLHDFPGQGTALVGVLDPFWDAKPYVTADEFRAFCSPLVLLAEMEKRYWRQGEQFVAAVQVAHFGPAEVKDAVIAWSVADAEGKEMAAGRFGAATLPMRDNHAIGQVKLSLASFPAPAKYTLRLALEGSDNTNTWDFWLYADVVESLAPAAIHETATLDETALAILRGGGKVLFTPRTEDVYVTSEIGFSTTFWNTAWTKALGHSTEWPRGQAPHTLGILCDPAHPALAHFPTEAHSNWQWWEVIHGAAAMVLDALPADLRAIIQPIDTWFECQRLGLLFEATVEGGKLLVCSMDIASQLDTRIVARQMRYSLLQYMASDAFVPAHALQVEEIRTVLCRK